MCAANKSSLSEFSGDMSAMINPRIPLKRLTHRFSGMPRPTPACLQIFSTPTTYIEALMRIGITVDGSKFHADHKLSGVSGCANTNQCILSHFLFYCPSGVRTGV